MQCHSRILPVIPFIMGLLSSNPILVRFNHYHVNHNQTITKFQFYDSTTQIVTNAEPLCLYKKGFMLIQKMPKSKTDPQVMRVQTE
jgi:hypothetical protein